jgi:flagellar basal body-associated protein FliL
MAEDNKTEADGGGLELDTLDDFIIPDAKTDKPEPSPEGAKRPEPDKVPAKTGSKRKKRYVGPIIAGVLAVLLIILVFQYAARHDFTLALNSGKQGGTSEHFLRVGPISATLPNSDIVHLTVDIGCGSDSEKERLSKKESMVRNAILSVISGPETGKQFEDQRYDEIKDRIKKNIEKVTENPVGEIYFSELRFF